MSWHISDIAERLRKLAGDNIPGKRDINSVAPWRVREGCPFRRHLRGGNGKNMQIPGMLSPANFRQPCRAVRTFCRCLRCFNDSFCARSVMSGLHAARALTATFVLLASVLLGHAQKIYSVGVYSMGRTHECDWSPITRGGLRFGFEQYRQYQDASGTDLSVFSDVTTKGVASPRYTEIYYGKSHFRVRGPAWFGATIAGVVFVSASLALVVGVARIRQPGRRNALNLKGFQPDAADNG
jgi:hypothetical protein